MFWLVRAIRKRKRGDGVEVTAGGEPGFVAVKAKQGCEDTGLRLDWKSPATRRSKDSDMGCGWGVRGRGSETEERPCYIWGAEEKQHGWDTRRKWESSRRQNQKNRRGLGLGFSCNRRHHRKVLSERDNLRSSIFPPPSPRLVKPAEENAVLDTWFIDDSSQGSSQTTPALQTLPMLKCVLSKPAKLETIC